MTDKLADECHGYDLNGDPVKTVYSIVIDHDQDADMSWLDQDCYDPSHSSFEGTYRTAPDGKIGTAYDPEWYRDHANHVALEMVAYDDEGNVLDCLGGIDFLADGADWKTGTFYTLRALATAPYLQELAREMGLGGLSDGDNRY